jgi:hypothetical protein
MLRSHPLALVFLSASAALPLGCAQILGDYDLTAGSTGATSLASSSSAVTSSGAGGAGAGGAPGSTSASAGGGGQGDGGQIDTGIDPCGAGTTEAFKDDFASPLSGMPWNAYAEAPDHGSASEVNGVLTITTDGFVPDGNNEAFAGFYSGGAPLSLLSCHVAIQVKGAMVVNDDMAVRFELVNDTDAAAVKTLRISLVGSDLIFHDYLDGDASGTDQNQQHLKYDPKVHAWWRFRESGGKVLSETSIDGKTWYSRYSINTPGFAKAVHVNLNMGSKAQMQTMGSVTFDNLNKLPL